MKKGEFPHATTAEPGFLYWAYHTEQGFVIVEIIETLVRIQHLANAYKRRKIVQLATNRSEVDVPAGHLAMIFEPAEESFYPSEGFMDMIDEMPDPSQCPYLWVANKSARKK